MLRNEVVDLALMNADMNRLNGGVFGLVKKGSLQCYLVHLPTTVWLSVGNDVIKH